MKAKGGQGAAAPGYANGNLLFRICKTWFKTRDLSPEQER